MKPILKKFFVIFVITWLSLAAMPGQENADSAGKSFLWQVEGTAGKSYLLGSIHLLKEEHYPLKKAIEDAFAQTDVLAVEADVSAKNLAKQGMMLLQKGMYQGEDSLIKNLSEKTYRMAEKRLKDLGMDVVGFQKFKPWMVAMTISSLELIKLGFNPNLGVDKYFLEKASDKKEIAELEGMEFQINLFESFSKEENDKFLASTIIEADQTAKDIDTLVKAWACGDIEQAEKSINENIHKYPELEAMYKKLLDVRNENMVEKIISYLKSAKKYFVIVGAGHMVGKRGIVQLLQEKGFTVTQL
ncbi:MAG: TraB/GumN family protein [Candidatus Aminicenantes bacterium]|nr:TraB/GumN family protein [Candidatus Aminicenantes bacterium]